LYAIFSCAIGIYMQETASNFSRQFNSYRRKMVLGMWNIL